MFNLTNYFSFKRVSIIKSFVIVLAAGLIWSMTYNASQAQTPTIKPEADSVVVQGSSPWIDIKVGSDAAPVEDLFGLSFVFRFETDHMSIVDDTAGTFLGSDIVYFSQIENSIGEVAVSVTRKSGQSEVSGHGVVARLQAQLDQQVPDDTHINFQLVDVTANDSSGTDIDLDPEAFTLTVVKNRPPVAEPDTISLVKDSEHIFNAVENDRDPDQDSIYIESVSNGHHGTAELLADNERILYEPATGFTGDDSLTYVLTDGELQARGKVHVTVNEPSPGNEAPIVDLPLEFSFLEDSTFTFDLRQVADDPNHDFSDLSFDISSPSGELNFQQSENMMTISAGANEYGQYTVYLEATDPEGAMDMDSAQVTIGPVNDPPQVNGQVAEDSVHSATEVTLVDQSTDSLDPKGSIATRTWKVTEVNSGDTETIETNQETYDYEFDQDGDYKIHLKVTDNGGLTDSGIVDTVHVQITDIEEPGSQPRTFALQQNYPNPFNPSTTIQFSLAEAVPVELAVYNTIGKRVETLVSEKMNAGHHSVTFEASELPTGAYIYRLDAGEFTQTRKMLLVK